MESIQKRLKRFIADDLEIFGWMTIMMQNGEVNKAFQSGLYQCVVLSTHSIIQTIAQNLFGLSGLDGTRFLSIASPASELSTMSTPSPPVRSRISSTKAQGIENSLRLLKRSMRCGM